MVIVCPSCASEYTLDPARLGPRGREVRCASCRTAWFAKPEPAARGKGTAPGRRKGRRASKPGAARPPGYWRDRAAVAALVLCIVGGAAAFALRQDTVRLVPGSAGLFAALGLPVNLVGLRLEAVESGLVMENGARILVVEGALVPAGGREVAVPRLAYAIESGEGRVLYDWTTRPPVDRVAPGETVRFTARLPSPPPDGRRVVVSFAPARPGADVASR